MITNQIYTSTRAALAQAREDCQTAQMQGQATGSLYYRLAGGRLLCVEMDEAAESSRSNRCYLLGSWHYYVADDPGSWGCPTPGSEGRSRHLSL